MNKKKIIILIIIILLTITVFLTKILVKTPQDIRKKAFSPTGAISTSLSISSTTLQQGSSIPVPIVIVSNTLKSIRTAGFNLSFNPQYFQVSNISCNSVFPITVRNTVDQANNLVLISCAKNGGDAPLILNPNQPVTIGTFTLTALTTGSTSINFIRGIIPDALNDQDLSLQPQAVNFTILTTPTNTPTPTLTPSPPQSNTPTPTNTPTCIKGNLGNINCDPEGKINQIDLMILQNSWTRTGPPPIPVSGQRSSDLNGDNKVDEKDVTILLFNWNP